MRLLEQLFVTSRLAGNSPGEGCIYWICPPELLGQVLSQLRCGRALGRFSAASAHCRDVAVSTASAW
eukprot:COSAG02_NODE_60192_length_272_cov_0.589595_1_plen_66_part_01